MGQKDFSYANLANLNAMEALYQNYKQDPNSVEPSWRHFFEGMEFGSSAMPSAPATIQESPDLRIYLLIDTYRKFGHLMTSCNPISTIVAKEPHELNLQKLGFKESELDAQFPTCGFLKERSAPLRTIVDALKRTYCGKIGVEYMGLGSPELEAWVQSKIEPYFPLELSSEDKVRIMHQLNKAELFEMFIHTKYVGQKRFSLEGGETLIPMLSAIIETGAEIDALEFIIGMAHRGRLNVLANILNKSYSLIFNEFEDFLSPDLVEGTGDVKYHKGFVGALDTKNGKRIPVTLVANPSHLESVDPVVEGIARAKQELLRDKSKERPGIIPVLIHGDAALAGQGVVYETMQFANLNGYSTGGTVHLVINNQIGFTTLPKDSRSTLYCTEIARSFRSPVFHVNAEDPEGCVRVAKLAMQIRNKFHCDVFIDLNCYRKYGHNEGDEPTFTQPLEYAIIKNKKSIRTLFKEQLIKETVLNEPQAAQLEEEFKKSLQDALQETSSSVPLKAKTEKPSSDAALSQIATAVDAATLKQMADRLCAVPEDMKIHPKIQRLLQDRLAMVQSDPNKATIDWGMGESLAYATLVNEGVHVRLSGQDARRGTFSHRHAIWMDQVKEQKYFPLSHIREAQAPFDVYNSPLSEYAVLGFDFGYSVAYPNSLVIWEAQFGDFANGAQIIIDQYISSSEQKWGLSTNLTLLLPHGYEGQGPEHSSARMERFLQLAGHDNTRIANCTEPAQLFHLLRAQALNATKKPLIIFSPKALLRHPLCVSSLQDFTQGHFREVLDDPMKPAAPKKLLFCSGKIYYELAAERQKQNRSDVAILRIEQLYPFPKAHIERLLEQYKGYAQCAWVQEEHQNMGAWEYIHHNFEHPIQYVGRDRSASPAVGSHKLHHQQHETLMRQAFEVTT
ncbi:MAG: 2-oxoglutarate dehydrogenase E1 component [Verrucomicrobia bacterium]|nr:2-oxoglutarate dehydrogenase E1 component [Verrucomicrobiota bacterium]